MFRFLGLCFGTLVARLAVAEVSNSREGDRDASKRGEAASSAHKATFVRQVLLAARSAILVRLETLGDCALQNLSRTGNPEEIWAKQQFATHRVLMPGSESNSVGPNAVSLRRRPEEEPR